MTDITATTNRTTLFWIGAAALFTSAFSTAVRAAIASDLKVTFLDPIDATISATLIAQALGAAFLGFAIMLFVTSLILEWIGMRAMLVFAAVGYVAGSLVVLMCGAFAPGLDPYRLIWIGMFINGVAWGATEATINPMIAALYPESRTHRMNMLHAYWPAGLIVGGLASVAISWGGFGWRPALALVPLAALIFGVIALKSRFPQTESAQMGLSGRDRLHEVIRRPSFFIWFGLMFLTAASELAPGQWVDLALSKVVGMRGILLLVYVSALMFVGRHFAGTLTRWLSAEGLLCLSSILAAAGLFLLSGATSPTSALVAATVWGLGVCYMWPTMIATVAERYPRGGAWTIGLIGMAGALSIYFALPVLGSLYDQAAVAAAGGPEALASLSGSRLEAVQAVAAKQSLGGMAMIPAVLVVFFGLLWLLARQSPTSALGVSDNRQGNADASETV